MNVKAKEGEIATEGTEVTEGESHARAQRSKARKEDKARTAAAVPYICFFVEETEVEVGFSPRGARRTRREEGKRVRGLSCMVSRGGIRFRNLEFELAACSMGLSPMILSSSSGVPFGLRWHDTTPEVWHHDTANNRRHTISRQGPYDDIAGIRGAVLA